MFKKYTASLFILLSIATAASLVVFRVTHAEDDDNEEESDDREDDSKNSDSRAYTETVIVKPAQTVIENKIQTIYLPDRDRDGIADSKDQHPEIAEIYIVKDDNLNGIVDSFEYAK